MSRNSNAVQPVVDASVQGTSAPSEQGTSAPVAEETTATRTTFKGAITLLSVDAAGVATRTITFPQPMKGNSPAASLASFVVERFFGGKKPTDAQKQAIVFRNALGNMTIALSDHVHVFVGVEVKGIPQDSETYAILDANTPSWITVTASDVIPSDSLDAFGL